MSGPSPRPFEGIDVQNAHVTNSRWTDRIGMQFARVAGGVKRGLGLARPSITILNADASSHRAPAPGGNVGGGLSLAQLGLQLQRSALSLFGEFVKTGEDGVSLVDYDAMQLSAAFAAYAALTVQLRSCALQSPAAIGSRDSQLAFWLNLYCSSAASMGRNAALRAMTLLQVQLPRHPRQAASFEHFHIWQLLQQHRVCKRTSFHDVLPLLTS